MKTFYILLFVLPASALASAALLTSSHYRGYLTGRQVNFLQNMNDLFHNIYDVKSQSEWVKKTHVYDSLDIQNWTIKNILTSVHLFQQIKPKQKLAFDTYETHV